MDARLVRAYLEALPDIPPDARAVERARWCLASLHRPDIRYLVATVVGPGAPAVASVAAAILRAAGAPTAVLGRTLAATTVDGTPLDDGLIGKAGTLAAESGYQLRETRAELGEVTRREGIVTLALVAFAEASQRVALLVDEDVRPRDPVHAVAADLAVIGNVDDAGVDAALSLVPEGRPAVVAELEGVARERAVARAERAGTPMLLGGRDHRVEDRSGRLAFIVRGEPYVAFDPPPGYAARDLATGIAAALALGVMGIRMREDWVIAGLASLGQPAAVT